MPCFVGNLRLVGIILFENRIFRVGLIGDRVLEVLRARTHNISVAVMGLEPATGSPLLLITCIAGVWN